MKWLKVALISSISFSALFSVVSLLFYFGDWKRLFAVALVGAFVGLVAAPEFEKEAFNRPALFQVVSGSIAGTIIGVYIALNIEVIVLSFSIGGFLGWMAPYWIKHIQIP